MWRTLALKITGAIFIVGIGLVLTEYMMWKTFNKLRQISARGPALTQGPASRPRQFEKSSSGKSG
jgi:hypothetical protein